jgi:glycosyltransferase involved in cell wall biosynthesis
VRICLVYDHLFPHTVGGMERWLRDLAVGLAALDHDVTYLTMRHWDPSAPPALPGVRVLGLVEARQVYAPDRRTFGPPVRFGLAVARHLARHGREYDVVHLASFPYFPVLAAGAMRRRGGYEIVVDWPEVWTRGYWRHYAGLFGGTIGWLVQRACLRVPHRAHGMSRLHADRLVKEGYRGTPVVLPGLYAGPTKLTQAEDVDQSLIVYAGRHVLEKRIAALVEAFAFARRTRPDLRLEIYGDGPERVRVEELVRELDLEKHVLVAGRRPEEEVSRALARAGCLATASEREGYGLVVVEAAVHGTPSVVVAGPENAATELVEQDVNGAIAASPDPGDLAAAILGVLDRGVALRSSTARWFEDNAGRLRLDRSLQLVLDEYEGVGLGGPPSVEREWRRPA